MSRRDRARATFIPFVTQPVDQRHISTEVFNCRHTTFLRWWYVFTPSASLEHQVIHHIGWFSCTRHFAPCAAMCCQSRYPLPEWAFSICHQDFDDSDQRLGPIKGNSKWRLIKWKAKVGWDLYLTRHAGLWPSQQCRHGWISNPWQIYKLASRLTGNSSNVAPTYVTPRDLGCSE